MWYLIWLLFCIFISASADEKVDPEIPNTETDENFIKFQQHLKSENTTFENLDEFKAKFLESGKNVTEENSPNKTKDPDFIKFQQFIQAYDKTYRNLEEYEIRLNIFRKTLQRIAKANSEQDSATFGYNAFSANTEYEMAQMKGFTPGERAKEETEEETKEETKEEAKEE
uniref:Cathepsin propeptide inhibitor domain-containing protein n=1 Tax=Graphocephala atropunctata TaxID=36148 RepID=A0A1B6L862_9HEMI